MPRIDRRALLALPAAALLARPALAQTAWPGRQAIRLISPFPPGGFADTLARLVAGELSRSLGQSVVVENRVGAGGTLGMDLAAKAAPDGYTLVLSHSSPSGVAPGIYRNLPYQVVDDFTHLALLAESGNILMVKGDSPMRTLADLVAAARRGPVRYGSSGLGSKTHLMGEVLAQLQSIPNLEHVPYRGSAAALQDLIGGRIESVFDPITTNVPLLRDGQVRALAISTAQRIPLLPEIPTFAEQGVPQLTTAIWAGLSAPKGLPEPIAARLTEAAVAAVGSPSVKPRIEELATYAPHPPVTGAAFVTFLREYSDRWAGVARGLGVQPG